MVYWLVYCWGLESRNKMDGWVLTYIYHLGMSAWCYRCVHNHCLCCNARLRLVGPGACLRGKCLLNSAYFTQIIMIEILVCFKHLSIDNICIVCGGISFSPFSLNRSPITGYWCIVIGCIHNYSVWNTKKTYMGNCTRNERIKVSRFYRVLNRRDLGERERVCDEVRDKCNLQQHRNNSPWVFRTGDLWDAELKQFVKHK